MTEPNDAEHSAESASDSAEAPVAPEPAAPEFDDDNPLEAGPETALCW